MPNTGSLGRLDERAQEDLDIGKNKLWVYDDAVQVVSGKGIAARGKPSNGFAGEMPKDLTGLDDDELGDLLSNMSEYCGYIEEELSLAEAARNSAQAQVEFVKAKVRLQVKATASGRMTERDKNDLVTVDPTVVEATSKSLYHEAIYDLTKKTLNRCQRNWDTISRRITQRGQQIERMKRESNVGGVPIIQSRQYRRPGQ